MIAFPDEIAGRANKRRGEEKGVVIIRKQLGKLRGMCFDRHFGWLSLRNRETVETRKLCSLLMKRL